MIDFDLDVLRDRLDFTDLRNVIDRIEPFTNQLEAFGERAREVADDAQAFSLAQTLQNSLSDGEFGG